MGPNCKIGTQNALINHFGLAESNCTRNGAKFAITNVSNDHFIAALIKNSENANGIYRSKLEVLCGSSAKARIYVTEYVFYITNNTNKKKQQPRGLSLPHQNASAHLALALSVAHTTFERLINIFFSCGYFINIDREDRPGDQGSGWSYQPLYGVCVSQPARAGYYGGIPTQAAYMENGKASERASYFARNCGICSIEATV